MSAPAKPAVPLPVRIHTTGVALDGDLCVPERAEALVLFAHGSGSNRHSSRNQAVAEALQRGGLATLLLDLLTDGERRADAVTAEFRFDIPLLASRVVGAIDWARAQARLSELSIGLFGASTGAAAALIAAAERPAAVEAVVARGGRADLADAALPRVVAPTLLIVGGDDEVVLDLNRQALKRLPGPTDLRIVPGATHLFEEAGAIDAVSAMSAEWFAQYLGWSRRAG